MKNNNANEIMGKVTEVTSKITASCDEQGSKVISFLKAKIPELSKYKMSQVLLYTNLAASVLALLLYFVAPAISGPDDDSKDKDKIESVSISGIVSERAESLDDADMDAEKMEAAMKLMDDDNPIKDVYYAQESFCGFAKFFLFIIVINIAVGVYMFATKKVIPYFSVRWTSIAVLLAMLVMYMKTCSLAGAMDELFKDISDKFADTSTSFGMFVMLLVTLIVAFSGFLIPANKEE